MNKLLALLKQHKSVLVVFGFTLVSHILGFGREVSIAYLYGASSISDGLLVGLAPLAMYYGLFGVGYANAAMARIKTPDNHEMIHLSLYPVVAIALVMGVVFFFCDRLIVGLITPGLEGEGLELASAIVKMTSIAALLTSLYFWFRGIRYLEERFLRVSWSELMPNIGIFIGIFVLFNLYGVFGIAIGIVLGYLMQLVFVFDIQRFNFKRLSFAAFNNPDVRIIYRNTFYSALGMSGVFVSLFVDRYFASNVGEGSIASINFAYKVMILPLYTGVIAVVTVMFPRLIAKREDPEAFNRIKVKTNWVLAAFCIVNTLILVVFSEEVISLLFQYGEFGADDVAATAPLLAIYSIGLTALAFVQFNTKVRYALEDFKLPLWAGIVGAVVNVILDFALVDSYGTQGLAMATSIAAFANAGVLAFGRPLLNRRKQKLTA